MFEQMIDIRVLIVLIAMAVILLVALAGIRKRRNQQRLQPQIGELDDLFDDKESKKDDIIAVRKISAASRNNYQDHEINTGIEARASVESYRQASRPQSTMKSNSNYQAPQPLRSTQNRMIVDGYDNNYNDEQVSAHNFQESHPRESGDPEILAEMVDSRFRGNDGSLLLDNSERIDQQPKVNDNPQTNIIVINIFARAGKQFLGYELLQSLLSAGLRYGDMSIFHRHQDKSGRGPVIFSLASATEPGTFDIHKMGGFSGTGLSLFLQLTHNETDIKSFNLMLETAKQLADDLDGILFNMQREPLTDAMIHQYRQQLSA